MNPKHFSESSVDEINNIIIESEYFACRLLKTREYSKLFLWGAKLCLGITFLWPGNPNHLKRTVVFLIHVLGLTVLIIGLTLHAYKNSSDFNKVTFSTCMLMLPLMVLFKASFLWYTSEEVKPLIRQVMTDFWPYNLIDGKSKYSIIQLNRYSNNFTALFGTTAIIYAICLYLLPLFTVTRTLPFNIEYPFDWTSSPVYELLFCQQILTFSITMICIMSGTDLLVLGFLLSISCQYCILQECLLLFNTRRMYEINKKMRKVTNDGLEQKYGETKEFFVRCVRHHRMLLRLIKRLNNVLNPLEFSQLAFSCFAVCLGTLRLTSEEKITVLELIVSLLYLMGIVMQLSIDCFLGTHLYYEASLLPDALFYSNWIALEDNILKNDVGFLLLHSQRIPQFNTYNLYDMHMLSFLKVLKLAFSFYTVLSSLGKK